MLTKLKDFARIKINGCVALLLILIAFPATPFVIDKWQCRQVSKAFASISHPFGTSRVGFAEGAGQTTGSGPNYIYVVGEVRTYSGYPKDIEFFYSKVRIRNPWSSRGRAMQPVSVVFVHKGVFPGENFPYGLSEASAWHLSPDVVKRQRLYIVSFWGDDN